MSVAQRDVREVSEKKQLAAMLRLNCSSGLVQGSSQLVIIVERKDDWASYFPSDDLMTAQEYLEKKPGK